MVGRPKFKECKLWWSRETEVAWERAQSPELPSQLKDDTSPVKEKGDDLW